MRQFYQQNCVQLRQYTQDRNISGFVNLPESCSQNDGEIDPWSVNF